MTRYIDAKRSVLSPSTVVLYKQMQRDYFREIGKTKLKEAGNTDLQIWISDLSKNLSPKSVRNAHGLMSAALDMFAADGEVITL